MDDIQRSWQENAHEWIKVIDNEAITSRRYTNKAIIEICKNLNPKLALDVGCGEGWLSRALLSFTDTVVGCDANEILIENAKTKGKGIFYKLNYEELITGYQLKEAPFDLIVFNFSIYQKENLDTLLIMLQKQLTTNGHIIIQTLHPYFLLSNNLLYKSQWLQDSWKDLPGNFINGHKWFARTLENWTATIKKAHFNIDSIKEVLNESSQPISIIFNLKY